MQLSLSLFLVANLWTAANLSACQNTISPVPAIMEGRILDISSHTITIEADRRITYLLDLPQEGSAPPLDIGENVSIVYEGCLNEERLYQDVTVVSIGVLHETFADKDIP